MGHCSEVPTVTHRQTTPAVHSIPPSSDISYLSDVRRRVLLRVDFGADGPSPPPPLHHGVRGRRRDLILPGVGAGASFLQILNLLGLLLQEITASQYSHVPMSLSQSYQTLPFSMYIRGKTKIQMRRKKVKFGKEHSQMTVHLPFINEPKPLKHDVATGPTGAKPQEEGFPCASAESRTPRDTGITQAGQGEQGCVLRH